jgi:hypothetical protein
VTDTPVVVRPSNRQHCRDAFLASRASFYGTRVMFQLAAALAHRAGQTYFRAARSSDRVCEQFCFTLLVARSTRLSFFRQAPHSFNKGMTQSRAITNRFRQTLGHAKSAMRHGETIFFLYFARRLTLSGGHCSTPLFTCVMI